MGRTVTPPHASDGLRVDRVVLAVRADEADIHDSVIEIHPGNQSVLVPRNVEDHASVAQEIGTVEHPLGRGRVAPFRCAYHLHPRAQRLLRVTMRRPLPESLQPAGRDDTHEHDCHAPAVGATEGLSQI
jgi:hypothetical protein